MLSPSLSTDVFSITEAMLSMSRAHPPVSPATDLRRSPLMKQLDKIAQSAFVTDATGHVKRKAWTLDSGSWAGECGSPGPLGKGELVSGSERAHNPIAQETAISTQCRAASQ